MKSIVGLVVLGTLSIGACDGNDEPADAALAAATDDGGPPGARDAAFDQSAARRDAPPNEPSPVDGQVGDLDAAVPADLGDVLTDGGCVSFAGASKVCGGSSDGAVCALAGRCGFSPDGAQCRINCEMAATMDCLDKQAVDCLFKAAAGDSCDALEACGWAL